MNSIKNKLFQAIGYLNIQILKIVLLQENTIQYKIIHNHHIKKRKYYILLYFYWVSLVFLYFLSY